MCTLNYVNKILIKMIKTHGEPDLLKNVYLKFWLKRMVSTMWMMSANGEEQWTQVTHSECTVNTQKNGESRMFQYIVWT